MATITVKQEIRDGETWWRVMQGKTPLGANQIPPRPTDGGGFRDKADAEALRAQILRRLERKGLAPQQNKAPAKGRSPRSKKARP